MLVTGSLGGGGRAKQEGCFTKHCPRTGICKHYFIGSHGRNDEMHGTCCILEFRFQILAPPPKPSILQYPSISSTKKKEFYIKSRPANFFQLRQEN